LKRAYGRKKAKRGVRRVTPIGFEPVLKSRSSFLKPRKKEKRGRNNRGKWILTDRKKG